MTRRKRKAAGRTGTGISSRGAASVLPFPPAPRSGARAWLLAGLVALLVARPLFPTESAVFGDGLPVVMLWIALAVCWLLGAIGRRQWEVRFGWVDAAVGALVLWHTVAGVAAVFRGSARPAVNITWEWIGMGLCFLLARQIIVTRREARAVLAVMAALAVGLSGYGLYQYAFEMPAMRAAYAADPAQALRDAGLGFEPGTPQAMLFEDRLQGTEPIATFALTNSLAGYLAPWLIMLFGAAFLGGTGRRQMLPALFCAGPVAACLVLTKGRSAYAASLLGLALLGCLAWRHRQAKRFSWKLPLAAAAVVAVALGLALASGGIDRKVATGAARSLGYRMQYWQSTVRMIADRPLLGFGPGNYQFEYTRYKLPEASEEVADPHNFLLEIWATAGTPAAVALLLVLGAFFRRGRTWHAPPEAEGEGAAHRTLPVGWTFLSVFARREGIAIPHSGKATSAAYQDREQPASADAAPFALAGGGAGFLLAVPLGLVSWAPPGLMPIVVGLPCAAVAVALLFPWVRDGRLPPALPAVGVAVLLVHLLAAGALAFPGVTGTLWLLFAVGLMGDPPKQAPRAAAFGALAIAMGLAVACHQTAYEPVLRARHAVDAARHAVANGRLGQAERRLREAAEADPLAAEPWRHLAAVMLQTWEQTGSRQALEAFREADAEAVQREANSAAGWFVSGDWHMRAYQKREAAEDAERAAASYAQAVARYPTSGRYRARLALAHRAAGNVQAFEREAAEALRLDRLTPHADKKLSDDLRDQLRQGLPRSARPSANRPG